MDELSDIDIFDSTQLKNAKVKDVELTLGELGYAYSTTHKAHWKLIKNVSEVRRNMVELIKNDPQKYGDFNASVDTLENALSESSDTVEEAFKLILASIEERTKSVWV